MREIKFRAWDKNSNLMLDWGFIMQDAFNRTESVPGWVPLLHQVFSIRPRFILMQYAGLNDEDGKKLYEGDIVDLEGAVLQIVFQDGMFMYWAAPESTIDKIANGAYWHAECLEPNRGKLLGNIYENPELLEGK